MAYLIRADGTQYEIHPPQRGGFTDTQLQTYVDGVLACFLLPSHTQGCFYLFVDAEAPNKDKPINHFATTLLHTSRLHYARVGRHLYGDVILAGSDETAE